MTTLFATSSATSSVVLYTLNTTNYSLVVAQNVFLASSGSKAVTGFDGFHRVSVQGSIYAEGIAVDLSASGGGETGVSQNQLLVSAGGVLWSPNAGARVLGGETDVVNSGEIYGSNWGLIIGGTPVGASAGSSVINYGLIHADDLAIARYFGTTETLTVMNYGTIRATTAFSSANDISVDIIRNRGLISGAVDTGPGNDTFDNRNGSTDGLISMGTGNDIVLPGSTNERYDGGDGTDTLDFRTTTGIQLALDQSLASSSWAAGDSYANFENVYGSQLGADRLIGNSAVNTLYGFGGNDSLSGGAGNDSLVGGQGKDVLLGGSGNDHFFFATPAEAGDLINDFANLAGNNDDLRFKGSAFAALPVGALTGTRFWSATSNAAHDADDRFIFRTTDKTLWFDANGSAAGGPVLVADLQNTAPNLTAGDIFIY